MIFLPMILRISDEAIASSASIVATAMLLRWFALRSHRDHHEQYTFGILFSYTSIILSF